MRKKKREICAICGERPATTRDHIPPRSLYPAPRDHGLNLNTVPACGICNNGSSRDDEIFKMLIGIATGEKHKNPERVLCSLRRTTKGNKRISDQIRATSQYVWRIAPNDSTLQSAVAVTFDKDACERVLTKIVKGLHFMEVGQAIDKNSEFLIVPSLIVPRYSTEKIEISEFTALMSTVLTALSTAPLKTLNNGTFSYRYLLIDGDVSTWCLAFFGCVLFVILVTPEESTDRA